MKPSSNSSRRVSASRLADIEQCTMKFYLREIMNLPEKQWPRTSAGTVVHAILEALRKDKHRKHHDIVKQEQSIYASPAIGRLCRAWIYKLSVPDNIAADIDAMCMVAINHSDFLDLGADERFPPEHEFLLELPNGAVLKGFIDRLARYGDVFKITDYKTSKDKKTKAEVIDNYQSLSYQSYIYKVYKKLAEVRYVFLRHAPTKLHPQKHMMITKPASPAQIEGFLHYVQYMWELINNFGEKEAKSGYCQDEGFCERVCSFRRPFSYMVVTKKDGSDERRYWIDPKAPEGELPYRAKADEVVEIRQHSGCPKWNYTNSA